MRTTYFHDLPRNYLDNIYPKVLDKVEKGENILISTLHGGGGRTFINFFMYWIQKEERVGDIIYYDINLNHEDIPTDIEEKYKTAKKPFLVMIRHFEEVKDKGDFLQRLNGIKNPKPEDIYFVIATNHLAVTKPEEFVAKSTMFFSKRFFIPPMSIPQVEEMVVTLNKFYGWDIDMNLIPRLHELSGGIARLVKHICEEIEEDHIDIEDHDAIILNPAISFELNYLTELLIQESTEDLIKLKLIDKDKKIIGEMLENYFLSYQAKSVATLFPNITDLEKKILTYLYENKGKLVSKEKIADLMLLNNYNYSEWAIYKQISRLKTKLDGKVEIKNVKGKGYMVV